MSHTTDGFHFGIFGMERILPRNIKRGSVVMIEGPLGTCKSTLAQNFLAAGMLQQRPETTLLIRFTDQDNPETDLNWRLDAELQKGFYDTNAAKGKSWKSNYSRREQDEKRISQIAQHDKHKATIRAYFRNTREPVCLDTNKPGLIQVNFRSGAIFPEEFIQHIRDIFDIVAREYPISAPEKVARGAIERVVLDDVSQIGVSYPFLFQSRILGDMFLSALVHILRSYGVDLVITGTTGSLGVANDSVHRACALADTVVSCRFLDVFGDRYVAIQGEGLMAGQSNEDKRDAEEQQASATEPGIIRLTGPKDKMGIQIDMDFLRGLVGFDTGKIHRAGLSAYLFEENDTIHASYNRDIELYLRAAFDSPPVRECEKHHASLDTTQVNIVRFDSAQSPVTHNSLSLLKKGPFNSTVIFTVDEFWRGIDKDQPDDHNKVLLSIWDPKGKNEERAKGTETFPASTEYLPQITLDEYVRPYYGNVLLLAYRDDLRISEAFSETKDSAWSDLRRAADQVSIGESGVRRAFWFDRSADETASCALMDAILAGTTDRKLSGQCRRIKQEYDKIRRGNQVDLKNLNELKTERGKSLRRILLSIKSRQCMQRRIADEIAALSQLMFLSQFDSGGAPLGVPADSHARLPDDAAVYLCWYSQLRELVDRQPKLATRLKVRALPGRGFRGDWYVGVARGSVSLSLGKDVIEMLTSPQEEYKRFARGIGLPTLRAFYHGKDQEPRLFAWLRGNKVPLDDVLKIHQNAHSRHYIPGYEKFRSALSCICRQIGPLAGDQRPTVDEIREIVGRLPNQILMLAPEA